MPKNFESEAYLLAAP